MTIVVYLDKEDIDITYSTKFLHKYKKYRKLGEISTGWKNSVRALAHIIVLVRKYNSEQERWEQIVSFLQNLEGFEATCNFLND